MTGSLGAVGHVLGQVLRAVSRRRSLLAAGLAAGAVATALPVLAPAPADRDLVLAAARDLPAGAALAPADVVRVALPPGAVPDGTLTDAGQVGGQHLAAAVRRGEPLTDVRLVGPGLLASLDGSGAGLVAVPVRLADPAAAALLRAGDRVDVLAAATDPGASAAGGSAAVVAAGAPVLLVPPRDPDAEGALVVLAAPAATAARLAAAAVSSRLSAVVRT